MNYVQALSPAKVNLTLDVFKKKPGANFHSIETVMNKLAFGDLMTLSEADHFMIEGDFGCDMTENLIYKVWSLLPDKIRYPVKVKVDKQIPTEAGLGGGSSNAATFLKLYADFFALNYALLSAQLEPALNDLGKDISFFLSDDMCALGTGFGEIIKPLETKFSGTPIYLYVPNFGNKTTESYVALKHFDTSYTQDFLKTRDLVNCGNTFDQIFYTKRYIDLFETVNYSSDLFHISGSGSVFFSFEKHEIPDTKLIETTLA